VESIDATPDNGGKMANPASAAIVNGRPAGRFIAFVERRGGRRHDYRGIRGGTLLDAARTDQSNCMAEISASACIDLSPQRPG